ncbi:MAG: hypothetical protein QOG25_2279 [Acetobacteraceae bacterium]|nr:hypothetical protein [Acetobacteraceae bacterium]
MTKHAIKQVDRPWLPVWKDESKDQRNDIEDACLLRLSEVARPAAR